MTMEKGKSLKKRYELYLAIVFNDDHGNDDKKMVNISHQKLNSVISNPEIDFSSRSFILN